MKAVLVLLSTFILIIISVIYNISVLYPLAASLLIVGVSSLSEGYSHRNIWNMAINGVKKSVIIYKVFALIGIIISMWITSGTVSGLMYYGFMIIRPDTFIIVAFILTSAVSMLLGTSFGTVSTIGIALMAIGRGFGINPGIISGAVISGAYLGDRSSPMSSSAILTATITESKLYENLKHMISTLLPALVVSLGLYYITGLAVGNQAYDMSRVSQLQYALSTSFYISPLVFIPPILIIILPLFKIDIKINMAAGIVIGAALAFFVQKVSLSELLKFSILGYSGQFSDSMLSGIIKGGGLLSMLKPACTIVLSSALNGIFEGTGMLDKILSAFTKKIKNSGELVLKSSILGLVTAMYGCSQTLSIMLTGYSMKPAFDRSGISRTSFARCIADTCVVLSPLIPWNIAGLVPAGNLGVTVLDYLPYAYFCLILPLITVIYGYCGRIRKTGDLNLTI